MKKSLSMAFAGTLAAAAQGDTATIYAITSTISQNDDNGADPNQLVKVTDRISASQPATDGHFDTFVTIRSARAGEAFRGVALAPEGRDR